MKKNFIVALMLLLCSATVFAGGAVNKNNFSAGYLRTLSKNTETKKPDATFYNPAGTAFMAEGLHIAFDNQFILKKYTADFGFTEIEDAEPVLFYPSASLVWKLTNFSVFANFGIVSGGGTLEYKNVPHVGSSGGIVYTDDKASSMIFGETIGVSYRIFDMLSVAVAVRLTHGSSMIEIGGLKAEYEQELSIGWLASAHVRPIKNLDISVKYQSQIDSEMEVKSSNDPTLGVAGKKTSSKLPAMIGAGIGYRILEPFYTSLSFNYYFNKEADYDYDNSWEIGLSLEYDIIKMLGVSLGVLYTDAGHNDENAGNNMLSSVLDSVAIGGGVELRFFEDLKFDISVMNTFYFDDKYNNIDLSKNVFTVGIGISYRLL